MMVAARNIQATARFQHGIPFRLAHGRPGLLPTMTEAPFQPMDLQRHDVMIVAADAQGTVRVLRPHHVCSQHVA